MVAVSTVSPVEVQNWNNQKSASRQNMLAGQAQNMYQRQLAEMDYSRNLGDFNRQADKTRMQIPGKFAQQGTLNSGLYLKALQDYAQARLGGLSGLQGQYQQQAGGGILQHRGYQDSYDTDLMRILAEQYARQAQAATQLGGWL